MLYGRVQCKQHVNKQFRADWRPIRGRCVYKVSINGSLRTMNDVPIMFQLKGDYCLNISKSKQTLTKLSKTQFEQSV